MLAPLQTTLLTPWEIALGKLLAAWVVAWVFLLISVPLVLWCVAAGGVGLARAAVTLVIVGLLLDVIAAVALCLSSLLARSTTSVVLSYLAVFALNVGTVIVFGLVLAATASTETVRERQPVFTPDGIVVPGEFEEFTYESTVTHQEDWWWLLAPNPFVVLADAVPSGGEEVDNVDPLAGLRDAVRSSREPADADGPRRRTRAGLAVRVGRQPGDRGGRVASPRGGCARRTGHCRRRSGSAERRWPARVCRIRRVV